MLVYRNSIDPETKTSPAMILFGRPLRDPIPTPIGKLCLHPTWRETLDNRDKAMAKRHNREREKWDQKTSTLKPLEVGDHVYIQNLAGNNPLRWERTGIIVEVKDHHQYSVKIDGSGRCTLRNRKHLRKFVPFIKPSETITPNYQWHQPTQDEAIISSGQKKHLESPNPPQLEEEPETELVTDGDKDLNTHSTSDNSEAVEEPVPQPKKLPLALRRLQPHNNPGLLE